MNTNTSKYTTWFDTEYYHLLYQYRDEHEARNFISSLVDFLNPTKESVVLDLACGRGRHAKFLSDYDFAVTGVDIAQSNIAHAQQYEQANLNFVQGDMRESLGENKYDYIFNLFTSFGYFDSIADSEMVLNNMAKALKPGGQIIIDFMNVEKVRMGLVKAEEIVESGVCFKVQRRISNGFIFKDIEVNDQASVLNYEERVQMLNLDDFNRMFEDLGLELVQVFGNFDLSPFNPKSSERLIMIAQWP